MIIDGSNPASIAHSADVIAAGGLVGLPTETVYGLAADAANEAAVANIFAAKGRPSEHPLIVHVANAASASRFASEIPDFARKLMDAFWPGPLTLILPRRPDVAAAAAGGQNSVGLRCPAHPVALALLTACAERGIHGLAAPSANQFGRVSPTTAAHVQGEFGDTPFRDMPILDGGACKVGIESTIIDCSRGGPVLLRPGVLTVAQIEAACGQNLLSEEELLKQEIRRLDANFADEMAPTPRASGTLDSHYAPKAKVRLMDAGALQAALDILGTDAKHIAVYSRQQMHSASTNMIFRRMPLQASQAAQQLFATLRELDQPDIHLIWVETPPEDADWDGVRDRVLRAAA
ncbi:MAG: L-threonylcarbamoyladenylate synthase [Burkholderiaceae bacterium]|nr:L-threonylcarbamoyladenylate synthase [Burkholderiaceae bacterium]